MRDKLVELDIGALGKIDDDEALGDPVNSIGDWLNAQPNSTQQTNLNELYNPALPSWIVTDDSEVWSAVADNGGDISPQLESVPQQFDPALPTQLQQSNTRVKPEDRKRRRERPGTFSLQNSVDRSARLNDPVAKVANIKKQRGRGRPPRDYSALSANILFTAQTKEQEVRQQVFDNKMQNELTEKHQQGLMRLNDFIQNHRKEKELQQLQVECPQLQEESLQDFYNRKKRRKLS